MNGLLGNPWLLAVLFALGVASGGSGSWYVQGQRLAATQARFDGFVTTTRVAGEAAAKESVATALADAMAFGTYKFAAYVSCRAAACWTDATGLY